MVLPEISFGAKSEPHRLTYLQGSESGQTLLDTLKDQLSGDSKPCSKSYLSWLIHFGAVYVNKERVRNPHHTTKHSDTIRVHLDPKRYDAKTWDLKHRVVAQTRNFLIVDKPSGLPMHATLDNFSENLIAAFDENLFITHRLDVPTSGLVLVSKTKEYQRAFNDLLCQRKVVKHYQAWVERPVLPGLLRHFMRSSVKAPKEVRAAVPATTQTTTPTTVIDTWDECVLEVVSCDPSGILKNGETVFQLMIRLHTGRTHQIRAQLAEIDSPILGDEMYGGRKNQWFGLHAYRLEFQCPFGAHDFCFEKLNTFSQMENGY